MVEHPLGKGEVVSSILPGSTRKALVNWHFLHRAPPFPQRFDRERIAKLSQKLGENEGTLFAGRSEAAALNSTETTITADTTGPTQ